ncbi:hypothetical protein E2562_018918 [Oryza meyeriana var. granulata]|uniref:RING-type E3 ubiquitin transferase n=1 Tax=Oryza meyeriana var. granulata TaxID=110450 RepID=A0A6G1DJL5_9ORYZ|nr:hypothetical protein E2562_018918 [Oryza meyeriana var. granulata]
MTDPVTVAIGQTYDRASIRRWNKNGCRICPVTGEKLRNADVVPNITVHGIIEQVLLNNGFSLHEPSSRHRCAVDKTATPFGAVAAGGVRLAMAACLVDTGVVWWLLHLLSSLDASVQDNAVAGLLNLSKHPAARRTLFKASRLGLIVDAVNVAAKVEAQQNAAAILFYLSSNADYCDEISRIPEAILTLVYLIR